MQLVSLKSSIFIFSIAASISGCSFFDVTYVKCTPWVPLIGFKGILNQDIDAAIRESAGGAKCEIRYRGV